MKPRKLDDIIQKRRSIRKFSKKMPSWRDISHAINAARLSPLAGNIPVIRFLVIKDEKTIENLAENCQQDWIKFAKFVAVVCSKDENLVLNYEKRGKKYARQQAGAAIENFLLKIEELGLATCWVGAFYDKGVKRLLKIPDEVEIEGIFPIGYEDSKAKTKQKRKPTLTSMVFWEKWGNKYMHPPRKQEI